MEDKGKELTKIEFNALKMSIFYIIDKKYKGTSLSTGGNMENDWYAEFNYDFQEETRVSIIELRKTAGTYKVKIYIDLIELLPKIPNEELKLLIKATLRNKLRIRI